MTTPGAIIMAILGVILLIATLLYFFPVAFPVAIVSVVVIVIARVCFGITIQNWIDLAEFVFGTVFLAIGVLIMILGFYSLGEIIYALFKKTKPKPNQTCNTQSTTNKTTKRVDGMMQAKKGPIEPYKYKTALQELLDSCDVDYLNETEEHKAIRIKKENDARVSSKAKELRSNSKLTRNFKTKR